MYILTVANIGRFSHAHRTFLCVYIYTHAQFALREVFRVYTGRINVYRMKNIAYRKVFAINLWEILYMLCYFKSKIK